MLLLWLFELGSAAMALSSLLSLLSLSSLSVIINSALLKRVKLNAGPLPQTVVETGAH